MKTLKNIPQAQNMVSSNGNEVPNQFTIITDGGIFFQSYDTIIAAKLDNGQIILDRHKWDYSRTTGKYRNQFLGLNKKETEKRIESGEIILQDLN